MARQELHYRWTYDLKSSPEELWPFVSDTNRFNRDAGVPSVEPSKTRQKLRNARRRLQLSVYGMAVEWEEQPFEWVRPSRFGVARTYSKGPMSELRALAELTPRDEGSTRLTYQVFITPRSMFGALIVALQMKLISARRFARAFRNYDEMATIGAPPSSADSTVELSTAAVDRIDSIKRKLISEHADTETITRLADFIKTADEFAVARIRPYQLADDWDVSRRDVLELCLKATRAGLLDLQWELLCPLCRGARETGGTLREISSELHCETCRIDFKVNFDRFVEVTFRPNSSLRVVEMQDFCMGSPQRTPHIVAQQLLAPRANRLLTVPLEPGRYRLRALELSGGLDVSVTADGGNSEATVTIAESGWPLAPLKLATLASLQLENGTAAEQLLILERLAWSDQAATAAEVTALQTFRDLFSSEALRPGQQISVGTLTVLFTDLRNSTQLYREIGDATAFGRVMNHFDVLKKVINAEDGALVKTIGDAVMAIFRRPASALKAMLAAQEMLAAPGTGTAPLTLKAGIHEGPCIAVTLNDRLDYFGSTVNMAARLESLSTGNDVVISNSIYEDAEVQEFMRVENLRAEPFEIMLKGFDEERFELWRVRR
ncbi:MAG: adenylate/guanylate cyclase domain-containing protein [Pyrinomonadaceae bacterium]